MSRDYSICIGSSAVGVTNEALMKSLQQLQGQNNQPELSIPTASFSLAPTTIPVPPTQTGFQQQSKEGSRANGGGTGISLASASTAPPQPQPEDVFGWSLPQTPDVQQGMFYYGCISVRVNQSTVGGLFCA